MYTTIAFRDIDTGKTSGNFTLVTCRLLSDGTDVVDPALSVVAELGRGVYLIDIPQVTAPAFITVALDSPVIYYDGIIYEEFVPSLSAAASATAVWQDKIGSNVSGELTIPFDNPNINKADVIGWLENARQYPSTGSELSKAFNPMLDSRLNRIVQTIEGWNLDDGWEVTFTGTFDPATTIIQLMAGSGRTEVYWDTGTQAWVRQINDPVSVPKGLGFYVYINVSGDAVQPLTAGTLTFTSVDHGDAPGEIVINLSEISQGSEVEGYYDIFGNVIQNGHLLALVTHVANPDAGYIARSVWGDLITDNVEANSKGEALVSGGGGGGSTAQEVWEYATRTLTAGGMPTGAGADAVTLTITDNNSNPVADCEVWITSDVDGQTVVAGTLRTDDLGRVTFMLTSGTSYYVWRAKSGVRFTNPIAFTAVGD